MVIRKAESKDLERIQQLNNDLFDLEIENFDEYLVKDWPLSSEGKEYFANAIKENVVFVAEENDVVLGYILGEEVAIPYYNFKIAELCNMCVDNRYRNKGVGKALYGEFESYFKSIGINRFMVTASFKNDSAKAFYKRMGFKEGNVTFTKF